MIATTHDHRAAQAERDAKNLYLEARAERLLGAHDLADYLEYLAECKHQKALALDADQRAA